MDADVSSRNVSGSSAEAGSEANNPRGWAGWIALCLGAEEWFRFENFFLAKTMGAGTLLFEVLGFLLPVSPFF